MTTHKIGSLLSILCLTTSVVSAQITSTTAGGNWWETTTWIGGQVPTAGDDVVVQGPIIIHTGDQCRNLTITTSGSITDLLGGNFTDVLVIEGNADVSGSIFLTSSLGIRVRGNIVNRGTWSPTATYLDGTEAQTIETRDGGAISGSWKNDNPDRSLSASGPLRLASADFDLLGGSLLIEGQTVTADSTSRFRNGTLSGTFTIDGRHSIPGGLIYEGSVTNEGILEADPFGFAVDRLHIHGSIRNVGTVRNDPAAFSIYVDGTITNEGTWETLDTRFTGKECRLSAPEEGLSGGWSAVDTVTIVADSRLRFHGAHVDLNQGRLVMGSHPLQLTGESSLVDARLSTTSVSLTDNSTLHGQVDGDVDLYGTVQLFNGTEFLGDVAIHDTLRDAPGGIAVESATIRGSLTNHGVIEGALNVFVDDDLINFGEWTNLTTNLSGTGPRTIIGGSAIASPIHVWSEGVELSGRIYLRELWIDGLASASLAGTASLHVPRGGIRGTVNNLVNFGRIVMADVAPPNANLPYHDALIQTPGELDFDSLTVSTYGSQVPSSFASAVARWWRLEPNQPTSATLPTIRFTYTEGLLGANEEELLEVFHSSDDGNTWTQLSTPANISRDVGGNTLTLQNAPATGDYLLSSSSESAAVAPSVVLSITGRPNIRIGAPSRYLVQYVNASDLPTDQLVLSVDVGAGAHIQRIEMIGADGSVEAILMPEDFTVDGVESDTLALLLLDGLAARESRSMFLIATADPESGKQAGIITVTASILGLGVLVVGGAVVWELMGRYCTNVRERLLSDGVSFDDFINAWSDTKTELREQFAGASAKKAMVILIKNLCEHFTGASFCASANARNGMATGLLRCVWDGLKILRATADSDPIRCLIDKVQNRKQIEYAIANDSAACGLVGDDYVFTLGCPTLSSTSVDLPTVQSFDPNEKAGPAGEGDNRFMSSIGRMFYTILFENKAEATAPAYRIVVHDTLAAEFDPSTVQLGSTSHEGFSITQNADVVTWDIVGIELPPNVNPPEGEGFVTFSVKPRAGLSTGTLLENRATIVFDMNPPIVTNTVSNVLDFEAPTTTMDPLPSRIDGNRVTVRWQSTDGPNGSGVKTASVFASRNGGGYRLVGHSSVDSLVVDIEEDGSHSFYALGIDRVGNAEVIRPEPVETQVVMVGTGSEAAFTFSLDQNYPNPFNPTTVITYSVPTYDHTTVEVFDVIGRRVARLVNRRQAAGNYRMSWDARRAGSGVYFCRLTHGGRSSVRKMILVR